MNKIIGIGLLALTGFSIYLEQRISDLEKEKIVLKKEIPKKIVKQEHLSDNKTEDLAYDIIEPTITNKRFQDSNPSLGIYQEAIWWDVTYHAKNLKKTTRAIKGILEFTDLFGETKFKINVTINDKLSPNKELTQKGIGFSYNQFIPSHQWMMSESLKNMKVKFKIKSIIYEDGTIKRF